MTSKLFSLAALVLCAANLIDAATFNVTVADNAFQPAALTIAVGDTVTWIWNGVNPHNVIQGNGASTCGQLANGFASATQKNGTFSQTFNTAGTISYLCSIHCGLPTPMIATITVGHLVTLSNFAFTPAVLSIPVGDTVTFRVAAGSHNVYSLNPAAPAQNCSSVPNGVLASAGNTATPGPMTADYSVALTTAGTYPYTCTYHCKTFNMSGVINVVTGVATTPAPGKSGAATAGVSTAAAIISLAIGMAVAFISRP